MKQPDYKMVLATNSTDLETQVTNLLRKDYKPHGSPVYKEGDASFNKHTMWAQAMYRPFLDNNFD